MVDNAKSSLVFSQVQWCHAIYNPFIACTEKRKQKATNSEKTYGGPLNLLVMLPGSQQVHISPVAGLESSVFHFRKQSRLLLQLSPYKMRQRQTPLNSHLHRAFMLWIIHCVWFSFIAAIFAAGVEDLKDWIKSHSVVFYRNSLTDAHIPKPWAYYRIMSHVYPHLLPNKLET